MKRIFVDINNQEHNKKNLNEVKFNIKNIR
jgi:hypothetical protein